MKDVENKAVRDFEIIQEQFKSQLDDRISKIINLWQATKNSDDKKESLIELYRVVHSLVGAGGTFGAKKVSKSAHKIEAILESIVDKEALVSLTSTEMATIDSFLEKLSVDASAWKPSDIPFIEPVYRGSKDYDSIIYLVEDDALLAESIVAKLERKKYNVVHYLTIEDFKSACSQLLPSVVIMDIVFENSKIDGASAISDLTNQFENFPPVIFISVRNDMQVRLAAARAGACRYLSKPLDMNKLLQTLDSLTSKIDKDAYRVLVVDDDEDLLRYYESILKISGMEVETLSDPLNGLMKVEEFKPDLILLDIYMPGCSGIELAQVIRQDDEWSLTPIMFLSTEVNIAKQLTALSFGGDDFLVKPIEPEHLVTAIRARTKRARWTNTMNNHLRTTVRESDYQLISMNQHNIVSVANTEGTILSVNDKFVKISGYSSSELVGANHRLLKSEVHNEEFFSELWKTIEGGEVWHGKICNKKKNGQYYWMDSTIVPFLDENGKPYKYISIRTDITELMVSKERLKQSQQFADIGSWDWNIITGELYWSDQIWELFGYDKQITKTSYENFLNAIHPDDRNHVTDAIEKCVKEGTNYEIEHRVIWEDGSVHWLHERGNVLRNKDREALNMLGVVRNIDQRKSFESALIDARNKAEEASQAKSRFLSNMSHEFRTPLNAIMGYGQLMQLNEAQSLKEPELENISEILKAGSHLLTLIEDVLDLAKIESGVESLEIKEVCINEAVEDCLQLLLPLAKDREITYRYRMDDSYIGANEFSNRKLYALADSVKLKQVIINLVSNAIKYNSQKGRIDIILNVSNEDKIVLGVKDEGKGLSEEQIFQLFNSFERLGAEESDTEGTGIGLVITKTIVEKMGGIISVESEIGVGSNFLVKLRKSDITLRN